MGCGGNEKASVSVSSPTKTHMNYQVPNNQIQSNQVQNNQNQGIKLHNIVISILKLILH